MFIDRLNLNQLRVFECVYKTGSMTTASQELHLTQSGVSQHIKALEGSLEVTLFDRMNQKLVPTRAAKTLFESCTNGFTSIENALWEIKGGSDLLKGTVAIGMPIEFGNNMLLPLISQFGKEHPNLKFEITLDFASVMNAKLLSGELDFAFVDEYQMGTPIEVEDIYEETFELCAHSENLIDFNIKAPNKKDFESLVYIAYQKGEPVLHRWFQKHYPGKHFDLNVRITVMDVQATGRLIREGFGVGVLPQYILNKYQEEGAPIVSILKGENPVINQIRLAQLRERTLSQAAIATRDYLKENIL